jgi:hypothetical protein
VYSWGQIRLLLQQFAGSGISLDTIDEKINSRYGLILSLMNWQGIEAKGSIQTTAAYTTGTITLTAGSATVTGTGTAWTSALNGLQLVLPGSGNWYTVTIVDGTTLTLDRPYDPFVAGDPPLTLGYAIAQTIYPLPADCRQLRMLQHPFTGIALGEMTALEFGQLEGFAITGGPAAKYILQPEGQDPATGAPVERVMLYPIPLTSHNYPILYESKAPGFDGTNTSQGPFDFVSDAALLNGCKADLELEKPSPNMARAAGFEAIFAKHFTGMLHVENNKRPPRPLTMGAQYTRHRLRRLLRSLGPNSIYGGLLFEAGDSLAQGGAGTWTTETPAGAIDGTNTLFTLAHVPLTPVVVTVNNAVEILTTNYVSAGAIVNFLAGSVPQPGDVLKAYYSY